MAYELTRGRDNLSGNQPSGQYRFVVNPEPAVWHNVVETSHQTEGWALSKDDYSAWLEGFGNERVRFLVVFDAESDRLVGCLCAVTHRKDDGSTLISFSMYYVHPKYRHTGVGTEICKHFKQDPFFDLGKKFCWGVPSMVEKYQHWDLASFKHFPDWKIHVFTAKTSDLDLGKLPECEGIRMSNVEDADWSKTFAYDAKYTVGYRRDRFLKGFMTLSSAYAKIAVDTSGEVAGFCVIRKCHPNDLCVGPLYSASASVASHLLKSTLESIPDLSNYHVLYYFPPSTTAAAVNLVHQLTNGKAREVGEVLPMFTHEVLEIPLDGVYSIFEYSVTFI